MDKFIDETVVVPTGDFLRQVIGSTNVSSATVKRIARKRGIFTTDNAKLKTSPSLIKTGVSPSEYLTIKEEYKSREDQLKSKVRSINWSSDRDIRDALPEDINYNEFLEDKLGSCRLVSQPQQILVDNNPNHVAIDFEIERTDNIQNLGKNKTTHKGRVEFKKEDGEVRTNLIMNHTSKETADFGNALISSSVKEFKKSGDISKNEEIIKIGFYDFNNKERVQFLTDLSRNVVYTKLKFIDTKDIQVSPDENKSNPPDDLKWMRDKVAELKLSGKSLHELFFLEEEKYYDFILIYGITCSYAFESDEFNANCTIEYSFGTNKKILDDSELTLNINVSDIKTSNDKKVTKNEASKIILDSLEKYKLEAYSKYKKTNL